MKDLHNQVRKRLMLGPIALDADNTPVNFNRQGFDSAVIAIAVGIGGITFSGTDKIEFKLSHGDSETPAEHAAVTDDDVEIILPDGTKGTVGAGGIVRALIAEHAAASITKVGYRGNKPNISILADFDGTHGAATPITVTLDESHPHHAPVGV